MMSASGSSANNPQRVQFRLDRSSFASVGGSLGCAPGACVTGATGGASRTSGTSSRPDGTDLSARSAIALLPRRAAGGPLLDRLAQVFLHDRELRDHLFNGLALNAGQYRFHHFITENAKLLEQRPRGRRQIQPVGPAVVRIGAPFDHAALTQPVEQARE